MAVNLEPPKDLLPVAGIRLGTAAAAIKRAGRDDVLLVEVADGATAAGVFTRSSFRAAPVLVAEQHLRRPGVRALLFNSGNANAATGAPGHADALDCCAAVASTLGVAREAVLPFSTGVIGVRLPVDRIVGALPAARSALRADGWDAAARAVMTTDTVPKACSRTFMAGDVRCHASGFAKGAGMIRPDMATMLAFAATDAAVDAALLRALVREVADESFNRVTIDGDTSTNDAFVVVATGRSGARPIVARTDDGFPALQAALRDVCRTLAQAIARDGEGATRFVTIHVCGGRTRSECADVAFTIAHSPLVKTAMFAGDANWGRFCAAIGRAGIGDLDVSRVDLWLDDVCVARGGLMDTAYTEAAGAAVMARSEYTVRVDLGRGSAEDTVWTSDLSYDYVKINAEYRT
jgi:glutamate N-acetyltransferase/amino-acid N-acetyltransferase